MLGVWWIAVAFALCRGARAHSPAPRLACPREHEQHCRSIGADYDHNRYRYVVNGINVTYKFIEDGGFLYVSCESIALDDPALPRFEPALRVRRVSLRRCWPRTASYADALEALNVTGVETPSPGGTHALPAYHIELHETKNFDMKVLAAMPTLRNLTFFYTKVTTADLALLPTGLERLSLSFTYITRISESTLARLQHLEELYVITWAPLLLALALPDTLKQLDLRNWSWRRPGPWRSCAGLDILSIRWATIELLPDRWLARCVLLRTLLLEETIYLRLTAGALRGAATLEKVSFKQCLLEALPAGLFDDARTLRELDLQGNHLHSLPGDLFKHSHFLSVLKLSGNRFTEEVLDVLDATPSLSELHLDHNTALDACPQTKQNITPGWLPLQNLKNLTVLSLFNTATRRVCASWHQLPRLQNLNLSYTAITHLEYKDLEFNTTVNITVALSNVELFLHRKDYESVARAPEGPTLTLQLAQPLRCDCKLYWTAAALRLPNKRLREEDARCGNKIALREVLLEDLVCSAPGPCPARCTCSERQDLQRLGRVLQVNCERTALRGVPHVDPRATLQYLGAEPVELDLFLANNAIDRLAPDDLPPELVALDLQHNSLRVIDAETMAALVSRKDRKVWLANNRLNCSGCPAAATLTAIRRHGDIFRESHTVHCSDGTRLFLAELRLLPYCTNGSTRESGNTTESLPDSTPHAPQGVLNNTSEGVLQYTTSQAPQSLPNNMSEGVLQYTTTDDPQSVSDKAPQSVLQNTTSHTPQSLPNNMSEGVLQYTTTDDPQSVSDKAPQSVLQNTTSHTPQSLPNNMSEGVLQYTTTNDPQSVSDKAPQSVLQNTTSHTPQSLPNNMSEGVLQYTTPPVLQSVPDDVSKGISWGAVTALTLGAATMGAVTVIALWWYSLRRRAQMRPSSQLRFERRRPNSDEWAYDAFVSFAHADEAIVREMVERLEGGPKPLRLCVHYRDWVPGGWIPAQIAASVRVSRRTVAVVSEAFLRSKWARAEFREAYAAALEDSEPRLVLVLLEDPMRLSLDEELRAYVSGNTYVMWGDPWFWRKLRRALPAPSRRLVSAAGAASPAPAPPLPRPGAG